MQVLKGVLRTIAITLSPLRSTINAQDSIILVKHANCPVYFVYIEPSEQDDHRRWCGGLVMQPCANLHTHAVSHPSSL